MSPVLIRRMIGAELLKLRRNRGLMTLAVALTTGIIVLAFGYDAIRHASDPVHNGPAGGTHGFTNAVQMLGEYFGLIAAILIGTEAGTADLASGVFRDLVATGRSRRLLFAVRAPAAIVLSLGVTALAFALTVIATFALAGGAATPGLGLIVRSMAWIVLTNGVIATLSVAIGSTLGARGLTLTVMIAWETVASNILLNSGSLGAARGAVLNGALLQFIPLAERSGFRMASTAAALVVLAWVAIPVLIGAWRTQVRDA